MKRLTVMQERFCVLWFKLGNATQAALQAGYSPKTAGVIAAENQSKPLIRARMKELQKKAENDSIITVQKRKELLTQFATETIESKYGIVRDGNLRAIAEINKMEHIYSDTPAGDDNRVVNIFVVDSEAKELIAKVRERTAGLLEGGKVETD